MSGTLKVRDPADPSGNTWTPIVGGVGEQGPMGPTGPAGLDGVDGATGPTGPAGNVGSIDALLDVDTVTDPPTDQQGLIWDGGLGVWKPGTVAAGSGLYLPLDGSQPMTGPLTTQAVTAGGAINANAGIVMGSGDRIDFPAETATKIQLYSDTFGIGVESGSTTLFASGTIRFRQNSMTGTQFGYIDASTGGGLIIDRDECDVRYQAKLAASTNHDVTWVSGWSGVCQYRVSPTMVTCTMEDVGFNADTAEPLRVKIHGYPAGVPAPWKRLWAPVYFDSGAQVAWYNNAHVEFNTDGVWLNIYDNRRFGSGEMFRCSMSWAR